MLGELRVGVRCIVWSGLCRFVLTGSYADRPAYHQRSGNESENADKRSNNIFGVSDVGVGVGSEYVPLELFLGQGDDHVQDAKEQVCDTHAKPEAKESQVCALQREQPETHRIDVDAESFSRSVDRKQFMSESDVHYTLSLVNHHTGQQIKLELIPEEFLRPGGINPAFIDQTQRQFSRCVFPARREQRPR
jgi:hypothetical protein